MDVNSLPDDPKVLKAMLLKERQQHQQDRQQHQEVVNRYEDTLVSKDRTIRQQAHAIQQLLRRISGPKQERVDPDQLMLFDLEELREIASEIDDTGPPPSDVETSYYRKKRGHGRRLLPAHWPREQVIYELSEEERRCPCCGEARAEIGSETSDQVDYIPASYKVIQHVRKKYACRKCQEQVAIAAKPPQPIERGLPGPGLLANTVLAKYGDHLPLYRQEDIAARHGVLFRRSTLCGWIAAAADLVTPLYERMCRLVLDSKVVHTDDTSVKLLDPMLNHARTARFWAYVGDANHPYSVYDFTTSRNRDGPSRFLNGYSGYLQADAYGGYDGIYLESGGKIIEVACWTHCRRYWWEARSTDSRRAHEALAFIARLYQVENELAQPDSEQRRTMRINHALPILEDFRAWLDAQAPDVLPKSPIAQAMNYTNNQWQALVRYVDDGDLTIDNNISERTVKIAAIGRKNWLFVASEKGGQRAAILFSLVASCKANQVEPFAYLRDIFARLPTHPLDKLEELLPDVWLRQNPQHRWIIDDLRRDARRE